MTKSDLNKQELTQTFRSTDEKNVRYNHIQQSSVDEKSLNEIVEYLKQKPNEAAELKTEITEIKKEVQEMKNIMSAFQ